MDITLHELEGMENNKGYIFFRETMEDSLKRYVSDLINEPSFETIRELQGRAAMIQFMLDWPDIIRETIEQEIKELEEGLPANDAEDITEEETE